MLRLTLEQRRAIDTWNKSKGCSKEYVSLAKGLPALIMNSGLMQTMAFLHEKSAKGDGMAHCKKLESHLLEWIKQRYPNIPSSDFEQFMGALMMAEPHVFQEINSEVFAWLRWMRQMAAAQTGGH